MHNDLAPIVLFVYNRPAHTLSVLESLKTNAFAAESILYVFSDGPKENASAEDFEKITKVRSIVKEQKWCKEVQLIESPINKGLAKSVIEGVTKIVNTYGKIVVLEDDLIVAEGFLKYMNDALNKFEKDEPVMQISGYCFFSPKILKNHSCFFLPMATSWGWGTWSRSWLKFKGDADGYQILREDKTAKRNFDLDDSYPYSEMLIRQMETKSIDSWAIRWWWSIFIEKGITLFPDASLVKNIGFGNEATHTKVSDSFQLRNFDKNYSIDKFPSEIIINQEYFKEIKWSINMSHQNELNQSNNIFVQKFINKVKRVFS